MTSFPAVLAVAGLLLLGAAPAPAHPKTLEPIERTVEKSHEYCYFRGQKYPPNAYVCAYPNRGMVCNAPKNAESFAEWGTFTDGTCR
jgi:hypothetical protein